MAAPPAGDRLALFSAAVPVWSADRVVAEAAAAGLHGVEWAVGPGQVLQADAGPAGAAELRARGEAAGLAVTNLAVQDSKAMLDPSAFTGLVGLAVGLGSPSLRLFTPAPDGDIGSLRRRFADLVQVCADQGLRLLVEVSPGTATPSPELVRRLLEQFPPHEVGALWDPGNTVIEGWLSARLAVSVLGPYLAHVHVKNVAWWWQEGRWTWRHAPLDTGFVDWQEAMSALGDAGYRGWLSLDHLSGPPDDGRLAADLALARSYLSR